MQVHRSLTLHGILNQSRNSLKIVAATALFAVTSACVSAQGNMVATPDLQVETLSASLERPWSLAFLPDQSFLVTERSGQLWHLDSQGNKIAQISGLPEIAAVGQGGLLDVALHPDFQTNQWVYFSYSQSGDRGGNSTAMARGKLDVNTHALVDVQQLFVQSPTSNTGRHFGARIVFDQAGYVYLTMGDRGLKDPAQDPSNTIGTIIRLHDDGEIPADNPYVNDQNIADEIFSYGNRNVQGAALHPVTGELWAHEHGPQGGDELNIIRAGNNYGWPTISYGVNYGSGTPVGEGQVMAGMEQPIHYWVPSIAPSGMSFVTDQGADTPQAWIGKLLVGSLKFQQLVALGLDGDNITTEERLYTNAFGRIRDVRQGPNGAIYLLTDQNQGKLVKISAN